MASVPKVARIVGLTVRDPSEWAKLCAWLRTSDPKYFICAQYTANAPPPSGLAHARLAISRGPWNGEGPNLVAMGSLPARAFCALVDQTEQDGYDDVVVLKYLNSAGKEGENFDEVKTIYEVVFGRSGP